MVLRPHIAKLQLQCVLQITLNHKHVLHHCLLLLCFDQICEYQTCHLKGMLTDFTWGVHGTISSLGEVCFSIPVAIRVDFMVSQIGPIACRYCQWWTILGRSVTPLNWPWRLERSQSVFLSWRRFRGPPCKIGEQSFKGVNFDRNKFFKIGNICYRFLLIVSTVSCFKLNLCLFYPLSA